MCSLIIVFRNLLKYFNFEIYILLDTSNIEELLRIGTTSNDEKVKMLAQSITSKIYTFKADLRKFYIKNGYAKILN